MKDFIHQFMWGFQQHFRSTVRYELQEILSRIGLQVNDEVKVLLIGIATKDTLLHQVCIEPEDSPLEVDDLQAVEERTLEISQEDPEHGMFHSNPRVHEQRKRELFLRSRAHALAEAIHKSDKFEGLKFFVSSSAPVEDYEVHTCLGIPNYALQSVPGFNNPKQNDYHGRHIEESFVQATINTCLGLANRALYLPEPGTGLHVLGNRVDIVRRSAERFVDGITFALTPMPGDLFSRVSHISSLTYERAGAKGHIVVTSPDNLANKISVTFERRIAIGETRSVRKLLELTDEDTGLLTDGSYVYGLGHCNSAPDVARIEIEGHGKWTLSVNNTVLIRVAYEHATLPKQILSKELFRDVAERTVGAMQVELIWNTLQCVLESGHGTTIVVSEDPVSEIERLGQEAVVIKPEYLDSKDIAKLGHVDGAIMMGADGKCYAFGVILDGRADSSGDRARGARYNSSVRYQKTAEIKTTVIVVSDDGTVDLIPSLKPRVWRQTVEDAVRDFCEYSGVEGNDGEEWARREHQVEELGFYLNQEQCDRVNEAFEKEMDLRFASGGIRMIRDGLQPYPDMEDSYFWDSVGSAK